jgi:hypothetical protein
VPAHGRCVLLIVGTLAGPSCGGDENAVQSATPSPDHVEVRGERGRGR